MLGIPFLLTLGYLFKKNVLLYHLLNLIIHLLNTFLVYFILKKYLNTKIITLLLSLIWALHPTQIEAILLSTNVSATFSYFLFFVLFYDFIKNKEKNNSLFKKIVLFFSYLLSVFLLEYLVILPIILFTLALTENWKTYKFVVSIQKSFKICIPYFLGLLIYLFFFVFFSYKHIHIPSGGSITLFLERIFWLAPQIFIHFLKLIFYPKVLSLDQTGHVYLGKSLFDTYSIFSFLFLFLFLIIPLIFFLWKKNEKLLIFSLLFFLSLIPFLHIISPNYCLASERYLYMPLFFLIFGITHLLKARSFLTHTVILLSIIFILCSYRTFARTLDWKDNTTLIKSTIKSSPNFLFKASRCNSLAETILDTKSNGQEANSYFDLAQKFVNKAIENLNKEKSKIHNQPLILKSYGLDFDSLLCKAAYLISIEAFTKKNLNPKEALEVFLPYTGHLDNFDPRTLELYANLLVKNNKIKKAKETFLYAYNKYPTSPFILLSLVRLERDFEQNLSNSNKYLSKGLKLFPYSKEFLLEALTNSRLENNLSNYSKLANLYGLRTHSTFMYREALTGFLTLNNLKESKKIINKLLKTDSSDPITLYLSGNYFIKKQEYKQALTLLKEAYDKVLNGQTNEDLSFKITNTIAGLYFSQGNVSEGIHFAKEALKFARNNPTNLAKIKELIMDIGI